jgi:DNA-binding IscR family transcriptional regulator
MVDLALRQNRGPVTLAAISERQHISLSYLEQLFGKLRRASLVSSVRGPGGGYNLARPPQSISVAAIVTAVDEKMHDYLSSVTLADLVAHQSGKPVSVIKDFRTATTTEKVAA